MSFLLDKAWEFIKHGPFPEQLSAEEQKLQDDMLKAAREYKEIVLGWIAAGVSARRIKKAGLWIEEIMAPKLELGGGGGGGGGVGSIIPSFIPRSWRDPGRGIDRAFVTRVVQENAQVHAVQDEVNRRGLRGRNIGVIVDDAPNMSDPYAHLPISNLPFTPGGSSSSSGAAAVPAAEEKKAPVPLSPWQEVWPGLHNAYRHPDFPPAFLQSGYQAGGGPIGISTSEARRRYNSAVELYGGIRVDPGLIRNLLRGMVTAQEGTVEGSNAASAPERIAHRWGAMTFAERQAFLDFLARQGVNLTTGAVWQVVLEQIKSSKSAYAAILRYIRNAFPTTQIREEAIRAMERPTSPGAASMPSIADQVNSAIPSIRASLAATNMAPTLIDAIIPSLARIISEYSAGVYGSGFGDITMEQSQGIAMAGLYRMVRRLLDAQDTRDTSRVLNRKHAISIIVSMMKALPSLYISYKEGLSGGYKAANDVITAGVGAVKRSIIKEAAANPLDKEDRTTNKELGNLDQLLADTKDLIRELGKLPYLEGERVITPDTIAPELLASLGETKYSESKDPTAQLGRATEALIDTVAQQVVSGDIAVRIRRITLLTQKPRSRVMPPKKKKRDEYTASELSAIHKNEEKKRFEEAKVIRDRQRKVAAAHAELQRRIAHGTEDDKKRALIEEQQLIERENKENMETDELDEKGDTPALSLADRARRAVGIDIGQPLGPPRPPPIGTPKPPPGGAPRGGPGGGGPPPPPPPGPGGNEYILQVAPRGGGMRAWICTRTQCTRLLKLIVKLGSAATGIGISAKYGKSWLDLVLNQLASGEDIQVNATGEAPPWADEPKEVPPEDSGYNIDQPQPSMDIATYERAADGRPKMFPRDDNAINYEEPPKRVHILPVEKVPDVSDVKVPMPKLEKPSAKAFEEKREIAEKFDLEDDEILRVLDAKPETVDHVFEYNANVTMLNDSVQRGDQKSAAAAYDKLNELKPEIERELKEQPRSVYDISHQKPKEYAGKDEKGNDVVYKSHIEKTERTAALGLDERIDKHNNSVDIVNETIRSGDRPMTRGEYKELADAQETIKTESATIEASERNPKYAEGANRPTLIEEAYPARVQLLVNKTLNNEVFSLSDDDRTLLRDYPSVNEPIKEYVEARQHYPDPNSRVPKVVEDKLEPLKAIKDSDFKLPASQRPFAEGLHPYPPEVQSVITRIADSDPTNPVTITASEREAISRFPDLEAAVNEYEYDVSNTPAPIPTRGGRVIMALTPSNVAAEASIDKIKALGGMKGGRERIAMSIREVEVQLAKDHAARDAVSARLRDAVRSGADRRTIEDLYRQQNRLQTRIVAETRDIGERGTYIDRARELLPETDAERTAFRRLQNVERAVGSNPDAITEYNVEEAKLNQASYASREAYYAARLALLNEAATRNGASGLYANALAIDPDRIDEDDTIVTLPDNPEATRDQGEGTERADYIDPDEQALFLKSIGEEANERRMWEQYSFVSPGFGLGGPSRNSLQRANRDMENKRFKYAKLPPQRAYPRKPVEAVGAPRRQMTWIPIHENDYGEAHFEDAFHNDYEAGKSVRWTNAFVNSADRATWETGRSIYQPDMSGYEYAQRNNTLAGMHSVNIGEVSKPGVYRNTDRRFYQTGGPVMPGYQNQLNRFPAGGEVTMITTERAGREDLERQRMHNPAQSLRPKMPFSTRL